MATNKASGLTARNTTSLRKASEMFATAHGKLYEGWFVLYEDFVVSGLSAQKYALDIQNNDNFTTAMPKKQTEEVMSAIKRAVKKYGSVAKAKQAHAKWVKASEYTYADISNFKKFAPEGQRSKSNAKPTKREQKKKELMNAGFRAYDAELALNICGIK